MACYLTPVRHSARAINPFFPRFPAHDFAPLFKLFDESFEPVSRGVRSFQPRFDVREEKDAFHLQGELPGINQQDVKIEFADQNTLTIHGRSVRESTRGTPPLALAAAVEGEKAKAPIADAPTEAEGEAAGSRASSVSHQATVEDEEGGAPTPATTTASEAAAPAEQEQSAVAESSKTENKKQRHPSSRYWVSERSVGEFHRSFNFPGHVDQDAVKASLKNGILSVIVPKAAAKEPKTIAVE